MEAKVARTIDGGNILAVYNNAAVGEGTREVSFTLGAGTMEDSIVTE